MKKAWHMVKKEDSVETSSNKLHSEDESTVICQNERDDQNNICNLADNNNASHAPHQLPFSAIQHDVPHAPPTQSSYTTLQSFALTPSKLKPRPITRSVCGDVNFDVDALCVSI